MGSKKRSRSSKNKPETDEEGREEGATPSPPAAAAAPTTERTSPPSRGYDDDDGGGGCDASGPGSPADDDRAARKAARKAAKLEIEKRVLSEIPTHDSDGMPYGKVQIRRMKRRVKHGLSPIPTEEEEREIRERERREREEEEKIYYANNDEDGDGGKEEEEEKEEGERDANEEDDEMHDEEVADAPSDDSDFVDGDAVEGGGKGGGAKAPKSIEKSDDDERRIDRPPAKKAKRNKPVPPGYVCMACQNKATPSGIDADPPTPHWIYDCPLKKTKKGCNKIAKKLRGMHDPPSRKVFVGGLPFDCDEGAVKSFFDDGLSKTTTYGDGVVHVKLLKFEDSKRCKGQAFLTFDTDEGAAAAMSTMNGSLWRETAEPGIATANGKKKMKGKTEEEGSKRELRLKVTRSLNRFVTGTKKTGTGGGRKVEGVKLFFKPKS